MKIRNLFVAALAALSISSSPLLAQSSEPATRQIHQHSIGVGLGQTFLMGDFEKSGKDKITLDFFYAYTASFSFDLLINLHSSNHRKEDSEVSIFGVIPSIKARFFDFDAFSPFLLAGLGFYQPTILKNNVESESEVTFGLNAGAGADLRLNDQVSVGLLAQFHKPFEVEQDKDGVDDVTGSYMKLLLTVAYLF